MNISRNLRENNTHFPLEILIQKVVLCPGFVFGVLFTHFLRSSHAIWGLNIEFEDHDVAILYYVFFPFHAVESLFASDCNGTAADQIIV